VFKGLRNIFNVYLLPAMKYSHC